MTLIRTSLCIALVLAIPGCGGGEGSSEEAPAEGDGEHSTEETAGSETQGVEPGEEQFSFGSPAEAGEADRTVEVLAADELAFDPATVAVQQGETIRFVVTNDGNLPHDFVIGDEAAQEAHAEEMAEMEGMDHAVEPNAISVPPGETAELTWTFDGDIDGVLYACHEPGHYKAGMMGAFSTEA